MSKEYTVWYIYMCEQSKLTYGDRNQKGAGWYWGEEGTDGKGAQENFL